MKISAIVPVYCEEKTVAGVIRTLLASSLIDEVICIDDASEDSSLKVLQGFGSEIALIRHKKNKGKGAALVAGIRQAEGEIVAFFDGDLLNFQEKHIQLLLTPLVTGKAKSTLGYGVIKVKALLKWTGERAYFRRDLIPHLKEMEDTRFGIEMYLNHNFKDTKIVSLPGLRALYKNDKFDPPQLVNEYIKEGLEVVKAKSKLYGVSFSRELEGLNRFKDLEDFRKRMSKIADKELRRFIKEYILKYIQL